MYLSLCVPILCLALKYSYYYIGRGSKLSHLSHYSVATIHAGDGDDYWEILLGTNIVRFTGVPYGSRCFPHNSTFKPHKPLGGGTIHVPTVQMRTLRHRKLSLLPRVLLVSGGAESMMREPSDASRPLPRLWHLLRLVQETGLSAEYSVRVLCE